ncbi:MAG TPA: uroporphyrinogen-III synthase [Candidatus Sulfotelmatobacter sp.]|jgi:uroporphyrinogen-III synthase
MRKSSQKSGQPLRGIRVLVGRARHQASALSQELRRHGASVIEIPFIEIRAPRTFKPLDRALKNIGGYDWLILTSVNGVEAMWIRMKRILPASASSLPRIVAIGPATRKAIEQRGGTVDVVPREYVAESVVRSLQKKVKGKRVLLVRAKVARDVIPRELRRAGARVDVVEAYETVLPAASRSRLRSAFRSKSNRPHVVTFTSSSTAKNFASLLGNALRSPNVLEEVLFASIGPVTSATLRDLGLPIHISAAKYTIPGLVQAIAKHFQEK